MSDQGQILLARQPIYDQHQKVVAYELLCRHDDVQHLVSASDERVSSALLLDAYTSISDQGEVKRVPAFISLSLAILEQTGLPGLPKKQVVLEFSLADVAPKTALKALLPLINEGYRIALSDIAAPQDYASLLKLAYVLRVKVRDQDAAGIAALKQLYAPFKRPLLACHIDDYDSLEHCIGAGFHLFQGNFLSKPRSLEGQKNKTSQLVMLQILQALNEPRVSPEKLERLIVQDPVLTYKLLRIVNSAAYALVRHVESVAQAVVLLGLEQVRKWATVISLDSRTGKPEELTRTLLIRGHMCEIIAEHMKLASPPSYFMAGMMSGIHLLLDMEQDEMLEQLPLADEIKDAISQGSGHIGNLLTQVMAYETGEWDKLSDNFDAALFEMAYRASLKWTKESMQALYDQEG